MPAQLLLDFGSVVGLSLFEDLGSIERAFSLPEGSLGWTGPLAHGDDPLWRAMQAGELSERDYWYRRAAELGERVGRPLDVVGMIRAAREADPDGCVRPEARALIDAARAAGRRVGLLTNELVLFYGEALARRLRVLDDFDTIVDGTWTRILKPDPRAYRMACVALDAEPADVVFVDDQRRNVDGALACGLQAVHLDVNRPRAAFEEAARRLGLDVPAFRPASDESVR
ncbi:MAG: HAD-IA family hydrolase [Burkholderiales bacterium]|jgi:putative hydrolase of the HAD superfamily